MKALCSGASLVALCTLSAVNADAQDAQTPTPAANATPQAEAQATQGSPNTPTTPGTVGVGATQGSQVPGSSEQSVSNSTSVTSGGAGSERSSGEIVVTGIRQSLANAQAIKRNSDTVVDAITASDIGALPDRSISEALQRVPGVDINHFAGGNDPDHFSVEGSGVTIRGLNFVRPEFNGRDVFEANGGSGISFADIPPELVGSVDVYKNVTAEMIEGGLAGTVNLNTRLPFDNKGFHIGFDGELNHSDFIKKTTPVGSVLVSNTWDTGIGTIGVLGEVSYSQLKNRADGMQVTNFQTRDNQIVLAADSTTGSFLCRNPLPDGDTDNVTDVGSASGNYDPCAVNEAGSKGADTVPGGDGVADDASTRYAPIGASFRTQDYNHTRNSQAAALQWESTDRRALLTLQFTRAQSESKWNEKTFETAGDLSEYNTFPAGCQEASYSDPARNGTGFPYGRCLVGQYQNYEYDDNGVFEKGYITLPGAGYRAADINTGNQRVPSGGMQQQLITRDTDDKNTINDFGANFKFNPTEHWAFNVDGQYTKATHQNADMQVGLSTFADEELDLTGSIPQATMHKPLILSPSWTAPVAPYLANDTDQQYLTSKQAYFFRNAMDHFADDSGHEYAFKIDGQYDFKGDIPFIKRVKFGARYSDRQENIDETAYNWGAISEVWSGNGPVWLDEAGSSDVSADDWSNFFRGKANAPTGGFHYNGDLLKNYNGVANEIAYLQNVWHTQNGATATGWVPAADRPGVVPGTDFLPGEMQSTSEHIWDFYGMVSFGTDQPFWGNLKLSGNAGVRHMSNKLVANGGYTYPTAGTALGGTDFATRCAAQPLPSPPNPQGSVGIPGGICQLGEDFFNNAVAFYNGASGELPTVTHKYDYWLPSFNLRLDLTNKLLMRFAASRVLAFPDIGYTRNFQTIAYDQNVGAFTVETGNPNINPALAWTFDLTAEWYFAKVGSLTAGVFEKSIKGFFYSQTVAGQLTNNGVTETVDIRTPENYNGTGKVRGAEVSYQQTFDFLPGFLSGFGVNANFTYLKSSGVPNSFLTDNPSAPSTTGSPIGTGRLPLEGLSKYTYNVQGFYSKGPLEVRAAWSWRSKNLQTASDVIFPFFPIYNDSYGQLDATIFYSLTKNLKIGLQGTNLTDSIDKTLQEFRFQTADQKALLGPRSYFINDRQYALIIRGNF